MGVGNLILELFRQTRIYTKSAAFFLVLGLTVLGGYGYLTRGSLQADSPAGSNNFDNSASPYVYAISLNRDGNLYLGKAKLPIESIVSDSLYRVRYQVVNHPKDFIDQIQVAVRLPQPGTESTIGYRFRSNGGALTAESQLLDPQTVLYTASSIGQDAVLTLELEVPKNFIAQTPITLLRQKLSNLPAGVWTGISVALPLLTLLLLFLIGLARSRRIRDGRTDTSDEPPSRLSPALLGILIHGRLTNRELAATLIDLARRGHLIIRQLSVDDFRFRRHGSPDRLADYEAELLNQIFGPISDKATSEEISFSLAEEVFSKRISQAFVLAYQRVNGLGYFYTNPLTLHRRYQAAGLFLFVFGLIGFLLNLLVFADTKAFILFWLGMMVAALLVSYFSKGLPSRTVLGDHELRRWLAFSRFLSSTEPINYQAHSQEKYLTYLPYAIIFEVEAEWTRRFYELPFAQPVWYIAPNISTIDQFANRVFPLFGYLSHALALRSQPASR